MLMEAITISSIIGASAFAVWFVKARLQPEIERNLTKIEAGSARRRNDSCKARLATRSTKVDKPSLFEFFKERIKNLLPS